MTERAERDESTPRIIATTGDPAGIGPDIALKAALAALPASLTAIGDRAMLAARAEMLGMKVEVEVVEGVEGTDRMEGGDRRGHRPGVLPVIHRPCKTTPVPGTPNPDNGEYVVGCIDHGVELCRDHRFDAMVTGPVNKAVINRAGIPFSGHTEWIAARCNASSPVMMLASGGLRVCLLTTHIPLAEVPRRITRSRLEEVIPVILNDLRRLFDLPRPTLGVCGLNPHAGEGGYLGREEIEVIAPALDALRTRIGPHAAIIGPIPADTAFTPTRLQSLDAVLAMYHDQGLPAIKHTSFGETVNITLGLPIIRTSVDHGTAFERAGAEGSTGADATSFRAAITLACQLAGGR